MAATKRIIKTAQKRSRGAATKGTRSATKAVRKRVVKAAKGRTTAPPATAGGAKQAGASRATALRSNRTAKKPSAPHKGRARVDHGDAVAVLKADHRRVEQLFKRFEKARHGAHGTKRALVHTVIEELSRHAAIEELVFYPAVRREAGGADTAVLEALEEHHLVKVGLRELEDLDPSDERFDAKVSVLIENVRHHVREEERELFPEVRDQLGRRRLHELGDELRAAKPRVPTRPRPAVLDAPPGNVLIGGAVAVIDRARTVGQRVVDRML